MSKINIISQIELLSLTLILSYFFNNNIIPVLIGVVISLCLIKKDHFNKVTNYLKLIYFRAKESTGYRKENKLIKKNDNNITKEDIESQFSLVESIEELGFIPSLDKNNDCNTAELN